MIAALLISGLQSLPTSPEAEAFSGVSQQKGFDTCAAPSQTTMNTWWSQSPYWNIGIYIGGANRACSQPNLTASWVAANHLWGLLPIWVGRQLPNPECQQKKLYNSYISLNTTTANSQGYSEAQAAYSAAGSLGMDTTGMPLVYDLEGYGGGTVSTSTCRAAAKAFIDGWVTYLHLGIAQKAGVYGSQCSSYINDFRSISHVPDFIWFADWDSNPSPYVTASSCAIPSTAWANHQRHKQYVKPHDEPWGGIVVHIDNDCSDGPVYLDHDRYDTSKCF